MVRSNLGNRAVIYPHKSVTTKWVLIASLFCNFITKLYQNGIAITLRWHIGLELYDWVLRDSGKESKASRRELAFEMAGMHSAKIARFSNDTIHGSNIFHETGDTVIWKCSREFNYLENPVFEIGSVIRFCAFSTFLFSPSLMSLYCDMDGCEWQYLLCSKFLYTNLVFLMDLPGGTCITNSVGMSDFVSLKHGSFGIYG